MTLQRRQQNRAGLIAASLLAVFSVACGSAQTASVPTPQTIHSRGNPILSDGSYYSADPAPIVVGDTLYILAGRDEAPPNRNDFIMNEWQIFATKDVASHIWQIDSLYRFNAKFRPIWEPRFVCYPAARDLPRVAIAALEAEAFLVWPRFPRLVRRAHRPATVG